MNEEPGLFYRPATQRILLYGLYGGCIALLALEALVKRHSKHPWEDMFAFYPIYGFGACVVLALIAMLMRKALQRSEGYYRARESRDER